VNSKKGEADSAKRSGVSSSGGGWKEEKEEKVRCSADEKAFLPHKPRRTGIDTRPKFKYFDILPNQEGDTEGGKIPLLKMKNNKVWSAGRSLRRPRGRGEKRQRGMRRDPSSSRGCPAGQRPVEKRKRN